MIWMSISLSRRNQRQWRRCVPLSRNSLHYQRTLQLLVNQNLQRLEPILLIRYLTIIHKYPNCFLELFSVKYSSLCNHDGSFPGWLNELYCPLFFCHVYFQIHTANCFLLIFSSNNVRQSRRNKKTGFSNSLCCSSKIAYLNHWNSLAFFSLETAGTYVLFQIFSLVDLQGSNDLYWLHRHIS